MQTLAVSDTTMALNAGLSVEGITMYLFWVANVAMGAGALFFWLMAGNVPRAYRSVMVVAGIICAVAFYHYYQMTNIYVEQVASLFRADGTRIEGAEIGQFPTAFRYIDWLITVPLLVMEFPLLLNLGRKGRPLFFSLAIAALVMLVLAWIAEESPIGGGQWWITYILSCVAWLYIVFILFTKVSQQMETQPESIARALRIMRWFIVIGWVIYPIGFLLALGGSAGESAREICYNIADVINKVFFGLVCFYGAKALAGGEGGESGAGEAAAG
jgi:bacteriorhodopsin